MIFIVYSQINEKKLTDNLGMPEYSYYFVLRGFLPVLKEIGRVIEVSDPEKEVDAIYDDFSRMGENCIFLSFSPPNKTVTGLRCQTVCVLAWEFDRIPDEVWDDNPKNDWRTVFSDHGRAITLSQYSAHAVKRAMGKDFPVEAIPVPVWDAFEDYRKRLTHICAVQPQTISLRGNIIDSRNYSITPDSFELKNPFQGIQIKPSPDAKLQMGFAEGDEFSAYLGGFYKSESWGTWSRIENPWVLIPYRLKADDVYLRITARGYGNNVNREISVSLGSETNWIRLNNDFTETLLSFHLEQPANLLKFSGFDLSPVPGAVDPRSMGIGIRSIEINADGYINEEIQAGNQKISLDGVVYTSVFNPGDDRKNWRDMVRGFCMAFREIEDATLVLKMTHHCVSSFLGILHRLMQQMHPFKCRIVALHGYLDHAEYENLITATSFYVNTSRCEGLCLPLMEFMSCGKPAIAPCNTALTDYVDDTTTLIVKSNLEPGIWPHDRRQLLRALRYRIDWESLVNAYRQSYEIVKDKPTIYQDMATAAMQKMKDYSSYQAVKVQVKNFLNVNGQS